MDAVKIQARVDRGYGIAAKKVGQLCEIRRPWRAVQPIGAEASLGRIMAFFDPDYKFQARRPSLYGKPLFGVAIDRTDVRIGDYLLGAHDTWFLAGIEPLLPTMGVKCNVVMAVSRPGPVLVPGRNPYSGRTTATDAPMMAGWPASILIGGRTQAGRANLPGDVPDRGAQMLVPWWPGVTMRTSDRVSDDQGRVWNVSEAELTDLGWRVELVLSVA